jgi:O-antigen ligase
MVMSNTTETPPGSGIGFACLVVFLYLTFSRLTDILLPNLYLSLIVSIAALVFVIASGSLWEALSNRPSALLFAFTGWLVLATPFSYWRGGSLALLLDWAKSLMVFVLIAGLTRTPRQCRLVAVTFAASAITVILQALLLGNTEVNGRLTVGQGVLSNPNDLAQLVLNGGPYLFLPFLNGSGLLLRLLAIGAGGAGIAVVAATGSRGALFSVAGMGLAVLLRQSMMRRIQIAALGAVVLFVVVGSLPADLVRRYGILADTDIESVADEATVGSTTERMQLLRDSIDLTLQHPLLGTGPGVFAAASADVATSLGRYASWHETHNSYTQVSSEAGIPALLLFLGVVVYCLRTLLRLPRDSQLQHEQKRVANIGYCLLVGFVGYLMVCMFSSIAYGVYLPTFAGFTLALSRCAQKVTVSR